MPGTMSGHYYAVDHDPCGAGRTVAYLTRAGSRTNRMPPNWRRVASKTLWYLWFQAVYRSPVGPPTDPLADMSWNAVWATAAWMSEPSLTGRLHCANGAQTADQKAAVVRAICSKVAAQYLAEDHAVTDEAIGEYARSLQQIRLADSPTGWGSWLNGQPS